MMKLRKKYKKTYTKALNTAIILLISGLIIEFVIIPKTIRVLHNPLMTWSPLVQNGRIFPWLYGGVIILCALTLLFQALKNRKHYLIEESTINEESAQSREKTSKEPLLMKLKKLFGYDIWNAVYVSILIAYALFKPVVGYLPIAIAVTFSLFILYAFKNKMLVIVYSVGFPVMLYFIFTRVLYSTL